MKSTYAEDDECQPTNIKKISEMEAEKMAKDSDDDEEEDVEIVPKRFNQRDSYSVQMSRMIKKQEKPEIIMNDEKIEEDLLENETDLKKWKGFTPQKKKRGSYFLQLKKLKGQQKRVVSFDVSPKNKPKKSSLENDHKKSSEKIKISIIKSENDKNEEKNDEKNKVNSPKDLLDITKNEPKGTIKEDSGNESSDSESGLVRNAISVDIIPKKDDKSSSSDEEGVKNYQKWDSFNPGKKKKRPLSFANTKKSKKNIAKPSNFRSTRPSASKKVEEKEENDCL